jgi:transcriptional regulator with XRE-family HTH domain
MSDQNKVRILFAKNLKRVRENLGLSQLALANEFEMAHNFINDIEHCRKWVSAETIERLCDVLKVEPYQLFLPEDHSVAEKDAAIAACCDELLSATTQAILDIKRRHLS